MPNKISIIVGIDSYPFRLIDFNESNLLRCTSFAAARAAISELVNSDEIEIEFIRIGAVRGEARETNPFDFVDWLAELQEKKGCQFKVRNCWPEYYERNDLKEYILKKGLTLVF